MTMGSGDDADDHLAPIAFNKPLSTVFIPYTGSVYYLNASGLDSTPASKLLSTVIISTDVDLTTNINATSTLSISQPENNNVALIVGVVSGTVGLLIGIFLLALLLICRSRQRENVWRGRRASVLKKNPQEKTFEPLDLSLALPRCETSTSLHDLERRQTSFISTETPSCLFQQTESVRDLFYEANSRSLSMLNVGTINKRNTNLDRTGVVEIFPGFVGSGTNCGNDKTDRNRDAASTCENPSVISSRPSSPIKKFDWEKRLISVSAGESFSSGLGTGTESDIYSNESKGFQAPLSESINEIRCPSSINKLSSHGTTTDRRYRSSITLLGTRPSDDWHRPTRRAPGNQRRRSIQKSNTSSSCASSGTSSMNDWASANIISPENQSVGTCTPMLHADVPVYDTKPSDIEETSGSDHLENSSHDEDDSDQGEGVVSTYFDLHFPRSILKSNETKQGCNNLTGKNEKTSFVVCEDKTKTITVTKDNSDEVIDL